MALDAPPAPPGLQREAAEQGSSMSSDALVVAFASWPPSSSEPFGGHPRPERRAARKDQNAERPRGLVRSWINFFDSPRDERDRKKQSQHRIRHDDQQ